MLHRIIELHNYGIGLFIQYPILYGTQVSLSENVVSSMVVSSCKPSRNNNTPVNVCCTFYIIKRTILAISLVARLILFSCTWVYFGSVKVMTS